MCIALFSTFLRQHNHKVNFLKSHLMDKLNARGQGFFSGFLNLNAVSNTTTT